MVQSSDGEQLWGLCSGAGACHAAADARVPGRGGGGGHLCDRGADGGQPLDHRGRRGLRGVPAQRVHHVRKQH